MGLFGRGIKDRVPAQATVLEMAPTAKAARQENKRNVDYEFRLRVEPATGESYEVSHTEQVPWDHTPLIGATVALTVSASDPQRVKIDWDRVPNIVDAARASAEAAQRGDSAGAAEALGFELRDPPDG